MSDLRIFIANKDTYGFSSSEIVWTEFSPIYSASSFERTLEGVNENLKLEGELTFVGDEFDTIKLRKGEGKIPIYIKDNNINVFRGYLILDGKWNKTNKTVSLTTEPDNGITLYDGIKDQELEQDYLKWKMRTISKVGTNTEFFMVPTSDEDNNQKRDPSGAGWDELIEEYSRVSRKQDLYRDITVFQPIGGTLKKVRIWAREVANSVNTGGSDLWIRYKGKSYKSHDFSGKINFVDRNSDLILDEEDYNFIADVEYRFSGEDYYIGLFGSFYVQTKTISKNSYQNIYHGGLPVKTLLKYFYSRSNLNHRFDFSEFNTDRLKNAVLIKGSSINNESTTTDLVHSKIETLLEDVFYTSVERKHYNELDSTELYFTIEPRLQRNILYDEVQNDLRNYLGENWVENLNLFVSNVTEKPKAIIREIDETQYDFKGKNIYFNIDAPRSNENKDISLKDYGFDIIEASRNSTDSSKIFIADCDYTEDTSQIYSDWVDTGDFYETSFNLIGSFTLFLSYSGPLIELRWKGFPIDIKYTNLDGEEVLTNSTLVSGAILNPADEDYLVIFPLSFDDMDTLAPVFVKVLLNKGLMDAGEDINDWRYGSANFTVKDAYGALSNSIGFPELLHNGNFALANIDEEYLANMPYSRGSVNDRLKSNLNKMPDEEEIVTIAIEPNLLDLDFTKTQLTDVGTMQVFSQSRDNNGGFDILKIRKAKDLPLINGKLKAVDGLGLPLTNVVFTVNGTMYNSVSGELVLTGIATGNYQVQVTKADYVTFSDEISIFTEEFINLELQKISAFDNSVDNSFD